MAEDGWKFSDPIDQGAHLAEQHNENAVAEVRRRAAPEQVQNEDGSWPVIECVDCDEPLPEGRLALGKVRCVCCQEIKEKRYGMG